MIRLRKHDPRAADTPGAHPADAPAATSRRSARSVRIQAHIPRLAFYGVVAILAFSGLRASFGGDAETVAAPRAAPDAQDLGAQSFAEAFARAYLTWDADAPDEREERLAPFLPASSDADAGLSPPDGEDQTVEWTAVAGVERAAGRTLVTVATQTSEDLTYLTVPVARDRRGFLYVPGHPAVVGPPATNDEEPVERPEPVDDEQLAAVVERTLTNYLARAEDNLLADLTPDAVVSLPVEPLEVTDVGEISWIRLGRRLAAEVEADDERGGAWSLRYELEVRKRGRWFVRALQVDPTFKGGTDVR